jgi:hypothetical protein
MALEKELARKLCGALETDEAFRKWFVAQLQRGDRVNSILKCNT